MNCHPTNADLSPELDRRDPLVAEPVFEFHGHHACMENAPRPLRHAVNVTNLGTQRNSLRQRRGSRQGVAISVTQLGMINSQNPQPRKHRKPKVRAGEIKSAIRMRREALELSQEALAELVGTSRQQIDKLEKGRRGVSADWASRLAPHLKCEVLDIVDQKEITRLLLILTPDEQRYFFARRRLSENMRELLRRALDEAENSAAPTGASNGPTGKDSA